MPLSVLVHTVAVEAVSTLPHDPVLERVRVKICGVEPDSETQAKVKELSAGEMASAGWFALPVVSTWVKAPVAVSVFEALS